MKRHRRVIGDPILRKNVKRVGNQEFSSDKLKSLIRDMKDTLKASISGIAIAAPQIGVSKSVVVVDLKKTPTRSESKKMSLALVNPSISKYFGKKLMLRDGCMSVGAEDDPLFGWTERSEKIIVEYQDVEGKKYTEIYEGFKAHVLQHEIDHLSGVLFVDRVKDPKTYTHASEYKKLL